MLKLAVLGTAVLVANAKKFDKISQMNEHPVNEEIVNEVKMMATSWIPHETHENPLSRLSLTQLKGLLGT